MARTGEWRRAALEAARLMAVIGAPRAGRAVEETLAAAIRGGARLFELRVKGRLPKGETYALARRLAAGCEAAGALLLVNDDADVALAAGADGVHVGRDDLPPVAVRRVVGPDLLVGLSVHDADEAAGAAIAKAAGDIDYVGIGTVFASALKPDLAAGGPERVRALLPLLRGIPGYAIGGIDARNVASVLATGVHGIAVASAIEAAEDVESATAALLSAINEQRLNRGT